MNKFFIRNICAARSKTGMRTKRPPSGVSPIIATLLLIAITVAAGVIVYVFVSGITGNLTQGGGSQTGEQVELTAYSFPTSGCGGNTTLTAPCITISIKDAGGSGVTIDSIYFDGLKLTPAISTGYNGGVFKPITLATHQDEVITLAYSGTFYSEEGYTGLPMSVAAGSAYPLKIVTLTGGLFSYTVIAGSAQ